MFCWLSWSSPPRLAERLSTSFFLNTFNCETLDYLNIVEQKKMCSDGMRRQ